jgi:glycosyltransferase involved in cell wall biosynthesis
MKAGVIRTGYPEDRVEVIPNLCNLALFGAVSAEEGARYVERLLGPGGPLVTYAGTLGTINRVEYLLELAKHMYARNAEVRFLIAGDGRERERLMGIAQALGVLGRNVTMRGPIPKTEMPKLLAGSAVASSLFDDIPEMQNNSANKFFDALAAGRPVMVNYGGWQADLLVRTGAGIVVPSRSPAEGAQLLADLLDDPERHRAAGLAAARVALDFSADSAADRLAGVLADAARPVAARSRRSGGLAPRRSEA